MQFLTQEQRDKAIERLKKAPDEVLLQAMVELRKIEHYEQGILANVPALLEGIEQGAERSNAAEVEEEKEAEPIPYYAQPPEPVTEPRENVSPGAPTITKIGSVSKDYLINELKAGARTVAYRDFHRFTEHLKLLWSRGEIKFDGESYYL